LKNANKFISLLISLSTAMGGFMLPAKAAVADCFDISLIGEEITEADADGNETTTTSYSEIAEDGQYVLLNNGDYFTYTVNVGEGQEIEQPGGYKLTYTYASTASSRIDVYATATDGSGYVYGGVATLAATGGEDTYATHTEDEYVYLKSGENKLKFEMTSGDSGVFMGKPSFTSITADAVVTYPLNKTEVPLERIINADGTLSSKVQIVTGKYMGKLRNTLSSDSHIKNVILFRHTDYIVIPVSVPYTAAYKIEFNAKLSSTATLYGAFSTESLSEAAKLTEYEVNSERTSGTAYADYTMSESYVLEAGKQYYFKVYIYTSGDKQIYIKNIRFTDNGEYKTSADLSALEIKDGYITPEFNEDITEYTAYAPVSNGTAELAATVEFKGATVTVDDTTAETSLTVNPEIKCGINETPVFVTVTSINGENTKTYKVNFIGTNTCVSLGTENAKLYREGETEAVDVKRLFDGIGAVKTNGADEIGCGTAYTKAAHIDIDLGGKHDLYELRWERTNQGHIVKGLVIWGSNDPLFETYEILGTSDGTSIQGGVMGDHRIVSIPLSGTASYRYVRVNKPSGGSTTFYPVKMDVYGVPLINSTESEDGLTTTFTVPSSFWVAGDMVIAASYGSDGRVVNASVAQSADDKYTVSLSVRKDSADNTAKVMVWKDFQTLKPRMKPVPAE